MPLRIVSYRANGVRFECQDCGLRFSVPLGGAYGLRATLENLSDEVSLRAKRIIHVLDVAAAARLEERGRQADWDDFSSRLDSEALNHVIQRLRRAETRLRDQSTSNDRDER